MTDHAVPTSAADQATEAARRAAAYSDEGAGEADRQRWHGKAIGLRRDVAPELAADLVRLHESIEQIGRLAPEPGSHGANLLTHARLALRTAVEQAGHNAAALRRIDQLTGQLSGLASRLDGVTDASARTLDELRRDLRQAEHRADDAETRFRTAVERCGQLEAERRQADRQTLAVVRHLAEANERGDTLAAELRATLAAEPRS